jgi:hypothetical protein
MTSLLAVARTSPVAAPQPGDPAGATIAARRLEDLARRVDELARQPDELARQPDEPKGAARAARIVLPGAGQSGMASGAARC